MLPVIKYIVPHTLMQLVLDADSAVAMLLFVASTSHMCACHWSVVHVLVVSLRAGANDHLHRTKCMQHHFQM